MQMRYREMDVKGIIIAGRSFAYAKHCQDARKTKRFVYAKLPCLLYTKHVYYIRNIFRIYEIIENHNTQDFVYNKLFFFRICETSLLYT
jgi:hypothetical protein